MKKRISALLLSVVLCLGMLSITAFAAGTVDAWGYKTEKTINVTAPAGKLCALWRGKPENNELLLLFYTDDGTATVTVDTALNATGDYYIGVQGESTATPVTVKEKPNVKPDIKPDTVPVTGVTLNRTTLSLTVGQTYQLTAAVEPANATDKTVTWTTSNPYVATVDENGVVTAVSNGEVVITATAGGVSASCTVRVSRSSGGSSGGSGGGGGGSSSSSTYTVSVSKDTTHGTVSVNPKRASKGDTVTITVTPDEGYELDKLTVTDKDGRELRLTEGRDGKFTFTMPAGKVTVEAAFVKIDDQPATPSTPARPSTPHPFTDVPAGEWYADAVQYVYDLGMMTGVTPTTFGPDVTTNRGMIVTMLYRLEGEPSVGRASFTDVPAGEWYSDAVAWAEGNSIVNGMTPTTFEPLTPISRQQMATILYRYASYKGYDIGGRANLSGYTDMGQIGSYAMAAMQWANAEGLITGITPTTLNPTGNATRAQVATILMRFCENAAK